MSTFCKTPIVSTPAGRTSSRVLKWLASWASGREQLSADGLRISRLIREYRRRGHLAAHTNPLEDEPPGPKSLDIETYGFKPEEMDREFPTDGLIEKSKRPCARSLMCSRPSIALRWGSSFITFSTLSKSSG